MPELIKPLLWVPIDDHDRIADALLHRGRSKPPVIPTAEGIAHPVTVTLRQLEASMVAVAVTIDGKPLAESRVQLPGRLRSSPSLPDPAMDPEGVRLRLLGEAMHDLCFPGPAATAFMALIEGPGSRGAGNGCRSPSPRPTARCWPCPSRPCNFPMAAPWP